MKKLCCGIFTRMERSEEIAGCVYDNSINMYWLEKALLVLDCLQVYGVLWNMAQSWPLPYVWLVWTKHAVWANADYFSTSTNGALLGRSQTNINKWGEMEGYLQYTIPFCASSAVTVFLACGLLYYESKSKWFREFKDDALHVLLFIMRVIYLPCALAVARLYYCEDGQLSVDPQQECFSGWHVIYSAIAAVCVLPLFIGLPIGLCHYARCSAVYSSESDHEKRLQAWEIAHVFKLDTYWRRCQLWTMSSFRRPGVYTGMYLVLFKAFSVFVFLPLRFNKMVQATVFWLGCTILFIATVYVNPFRVYTSNLIAYVLAGVMLVNSSFAMFDAYGVRNSVMVSGTQAICLFAFNACGAALVVIVCVITLVSRPQWPSQRALQLVMASASWPAVVKWVESIREGYALDVDCYLCPPECVDILGLEEKLRQLRHCWAEASSVGSVFSLLVGDAIEQLLLTHVAFEKYALRKHVHWDKTWLRGGKNSFKRRHHANRLMPAQKRRIILKLLALKAFIGDRVFLKTDDDELDEFGMPIAMRRRLTTLLLGEQAARAEASERRRSMFSPRESAAAAKARTERWVSREGYERSKETVADLGARTEALLRNCTQSVLEQQTEDHQGEEASGPSSGELAALFEQWNSLIYRFEQKDLDGGSFFSDDTAEEWFTYRHLLSGKYAEAMAALEGGAESSGDEETSLYSFFGPNAEAGGGEDGDEVVSPRDEIGHASDGEQQTPRSDMLRTRNGANSLDSFV